MWPTVFARLRSGRSHCVAGRVVAAGAAAIVPILLRRSEDKEEFSFKEKRNVCSPFAKPTEKPLVLTSVRQLTSDETYKTVTGPEFVAMFGGSQEDGMGEKQRTRETYQIQPCSAEDVEYALSKSGPCGCHHCDQDPPCRGCVLAAEVVKLQAQLDGVTLVYRDVK